MFNDLVTGFHEALITTGQVAAIIVIVPALVIVFAQAFVAVAALDKTLANL